MVEVILLYPEHSCYLDHTWGDPKLPNIVYCITAASLLHRYRRDYVVEGEPYAGYDRHNAEIAAFHLDR